MAEQQIVKPNQTLSKVKGFISSESVKKRFEDILGEKASLFTASIVNVVSNSKFLQKCEPQSIMAAAFVAAALDLPIDNNLGFAYIVPYGGQAQFQMGYKGFIQLAMRTGQYKLINACEVYDGELISENKLTGEVVIDGNKKVSDEIIGYAAFFKMSNGFEKTIYWSKEKVEKHGKKYSKSFSNANGRWKLDFDVMALKTVLKALLSKWGFLSVQMQQAIEDDQKVDGQYKDNPDNGNEREVIDLNDFTADANGEGHTPVDEPISSSDKNNDDTSDESGDNKKDDESMY